MKSTWVSRGVVGIVLATFFSDVGHEMVTAVLPLYLGSIGLGAAALGLMEGAADLFFSLSKLAGGIVGHRVEHKRPWATLGYLITTVASGAMALIQTPAALVSLRTAAWFGRGFRSPLRDFLLADEVGPTHFGRAYGFERSADMLGAVVGPLLAVLLVALGVDFQTIILVSVVPAAISVLAIFSMTRDRPAHATAPAAPRARLPRAFISLLAGVFLFGLGDFSRSFLILLGARAFGGQMSGAVSVAVLLYVVHNIVSAAVAFPVGRLGDRTSKRKILIAGYALGVVTNAMLAIGSGSIPWLVIAVICSGTYIAVEETIEKATAAELLPREARSLGLGVLACANAAGDMASSVYVGVLLDRGRPDLAFGIAAALGVTGVLWLLLAAPEKEQAGASETKR